MKERLQEFDLLRVIATFTVIAIHITAAYVLISPLGYIGNQLARFAVPLFIILSGFLLCFADINAPQFSAKYFYQRRFDRILLPYLIWTCVYVLMNGMIIRDIPLALIQLPGHLLWGTASYHLYFLVIIIQLYLLYPGLRSLMQKHPALILGSTFTLTVASQYILYLNMIGRLSLNPAYNNFYLVFFPVWIFYFVLGMMAALKKDEWQVRLEGRSLLLSVIWIVSLALLFIDSHYTLSYGSSIRPSVMLYTVSTYFLFYVLALRYKKEVPAWVNWIAQQSFLIYLMHPAVLAVLIYGSAMIGLPEIWARTRGMLAQYLAVTVITLLFTYLISLTPLADKLGGKTQKIKNRF